MNIWFDPLPGLTLYLYAEVYTNFDAFDRPQTVTHLDGTSTYTVYSCCGEQIVTNRDGSVVSQTFDNLKRLSTTTSDGITISNAYDAANRVVGRVRIGTNGGVIALETAAFDIAGRKTSSTNGLGYVTSFTESRAPFTRTTKFPNNATRIESYSLDGQLTNVTGTAVHGVRYAHDVVQDGGVWRTMNAQILLDTSGNPTSEATTNLLDFAGRQYKTLYADGASAQNYYNGAGQLWKSVDPDDIRTLFGYNAKGEQDTTIIDMEKGDSFSLTTTNRIRKTINQYTTAHGFNVRQTSMYQWFTNGSAYSNLVAVNEMSVDGLQTWNTQFGLTSSAKTVLNGGGSKTIYSTNADASYAVLSSLNGRTLSGTRYDSVGNQLGGTTLSYDEYRRTITVTDARNGSSTNGYDNLDRMTVAATPSPDGVAARQVTTTSFDNMGRATNVVLPDGGVVRSIYHLTGELATNSGARTYPVAYTYDYAGRMKTMTTWKNFNAGTGSAVTTWNYDSKRGLLVGKAYADGLGPTYTNTAAGRLKTRVWARGVGTTNGYNNAGDQTSTSYSDSTSWVSYGLDRVGRRTSISYSNTTETLVYDAAGNLLTNSYSGGALNGIALVNLYDSLYRRIMYGVVTNSAWMTLTTNGYDKASRLLVVSDTNVVVTYAYATNSSLATNLDFKYGGSTKLTAAKAYDLINRLTNIVNTPSGVGESPICFAYTVNSANQRTKVVLADGSYWIYSYDSLGQVTSGKRYWSNGTPVAGQQFEYAFDDIGNRTYAGHGGDQFGRNLRYENYGANNLNQYTNRTVPGYLDVLGSANSNAMVTVNNRTAYRRFDYYRAELLMTNLASSVYSSLTNLAVLANGTNADLVTNAVGSVFVPGTPEAFGCDLDGNMTNDGRWAMYWDGENRLVSLQTTPSVAGPVQRLSFGYDAAGSRVSKSVDVWTNGVYQSGSSNCYVFDDWNPLIEWSGANRTVVNTFLWRYDAIRGERSSLLAISNCVSGAVLVPSDAEGSPAGLLSLPNGVAVAAYGYGPAAEVLAAEGAPPRSGIGFATCYRDHETEQIIGGGQNFNPSLGRSLGRTTLPGFSGSVTYATDARALASRKAALKGPKGVPPNTLIIIPMQVDDSGTCGYAFSQVRWWFAEGTGSGFILQHVKRQNSVTDCAGAPVKSLNDTEEFTEAWEVKDGTVYKGDSNRRGIPYPPDDPTDTFSTLDEDVRFVGGKKIPLGGRKGTLKVIGKVKYIPGYQLQYPPWDVWTPGTDPAVPSGVLPFVRGTPAGWSDAGAMDHILQVDFNCCPCQSKKEVVYTVPSLP